MKTFLTAAIPGNQDTGNEEVGREVDQLPAWGLKTLNLSSYSVYCLHCLPKPKWPGHREGGKERKSSPVGVRGSRKGSHEHQTFVGPPVGHGGVGLLGPRSFVVGGANHGGHSL